MKKFLRWTGISATVFASFLSLGMHMAYAAETFVQTPSVTINGNAADIRAKYVNHKIYFSIADFWIEARYNDPDKIKLYQEDQVLSDGYNFISVEDQNWYRHANKTTPFTDPIFLEDDTVWVSVSALKDMGYRTPIAEIKDDTLNFKQTYWEFPNGEPYWYYLPLIPVDEETGLPAFSKVAQIKEDGNFNEADFHILSQELENGKTVFAYINKNSPQKFLLVTCVDGYVAHVLDNDCIFHYALRYQ